jgi:hypothetical protein
MNLPHLSTASAKTQADRRGQSSGTAFLASNLLELSCLLAGAKRAAIFRVSETETRFEAGYRMSSQLGLALMPQLNLHSDTSEGQRVMLGLKSYQCVVLHLSGANLSSRCWVVLFETNKQITFQALGRLEGVFQAWWQMTALLPTVTPHQPLVHTCSGCQHIMVADGSWVSWEDFLRRELGLGLSHGLCDSCCEDLYGELSTHSWETCACECSNQMGDSKKELHQSACHAGG